MHVIGKARPLLGKVLGREIPWARIDSIDRFDQPPAGLTGLCVVRYCI